MGCIKIGMYGLFLLMFTGCTGRRLIARNKSDFGIIRFYDDGSKAGGKNREKIYALMTTKGVRQYFSFYPDKVVMTTKAAKHLSFTLSFEEIPKNHNPLNYGSLSSLDSIVFILARKLIDSSQFNIIKRLPEAKVFLIEVNYYHGFPKGKRFRPL